MNLYDSIISCFKRYADFKGRSSRSELWYFCLFIVGVGLTFDYLDARIAGESFLDYEGFGVLGSIFTLVTFIPGLSVNVRRLHDINRTGWWVLLSFTVIGLIPLIYWACLKGDKSDNNFGKNTLNNLE